MNRQKKARQITYGIIIAASGLALMILNNIPFLKVGLAAILIILGLFQLLDKGKGSSIFLIVSGVLAYFIYPFVVGSLYLLGVVVLFIGIAIIFMGWKRVSPGR